MKPIETVRDDFNKKGGDVSTVSGAYGRRRRKHSLLFEGEERTEDAQCTVGSVNCQWEALTGCTVWLHPPSALLTSVITVVPTLMAVHFYMVHTSAALSPSLSLSEYRSLKEKNTLLFFFC